MPERRRPDLESEPPRPESLDPEPLHPEPLAADLDDVAGLFTLEDRDPDDDDDDGREVFGATPAP